MFTLKRLRKSILKTIFILVSANKKVFSKNQTLSNLFQSEKLAIIILLEVKANSFIFWTPLLNFYIIKPNFEL